jgi:hypothetical protein
MTPLRQAIITGDVPTASLWLHHAEHAIDPFERGVAMLEALADPVFEGLQRDRCRDELIAAIEDGIALEEDGASKLLAMMIAKPERFGVSAEQVQQLET